MSARTDMHKRISDLRCIQAKPEPLYVADLRIVAERVQAC